MKILCLTAVLVVCLVVSFAYPDPHNFSNTFVHEALVDSVKQRDVIRGLETDGKLNIWNERRVESGGHKLGLMIHDNDKSFVFDILHKNGVKLIENDGKISVKDLMMEEYYSNEMAKSSGVGNEAGANPIVGTYARYDDILAWQKNLCADYPQIVLCTPIGQSYENRTMIVMKVGIADPPKRKRAVFLEVGIHAREWIASATYITMFDILIKNYQTNPDYKELLTMYDWHLLPVANPDGYEYTHTNNRLWRKTRSGTGVCRGVDPNRNFDYNWSENNGSSPNKCSETYRGPEVFSEVECRNIRAYLTNPQRANLFLGTWTVHSYSQDFLLPWGDRINPKPPGYADILDAGTVGMKATEKVNDRKWTIGEVAQELYPVSGDSMDWYKASVGVKYTMSVELRPGPNDPRGFILPASEIMPSCMEMHAGMAAWAKRMQEIEAKQVIIK